MIHTESYLIYQEYQPSGANYVVLINGQLTQNTNSLLQDILTKNAANDLTIVASSKSLQLERVLKSYQNISLQYEELELEDFRSIDRILVIGELELETIQLVDYSGVPVNYYYGQSSQVLSISSAFAKVA